MQNSNEEKNTDDNRGVKRINVLKWCKVILILAVVLAFVVFIYEMIVRGEIEEDINNKLKYVEQGDLSWTSLSTVELASEIQQYMSNSQSQEAGIFEHFIKNNEVGYKIGFAGINKCKVVFECRGYSFDEYINYCEKKELNSYEEMKNALADFSRYTNKNYIASFTMVYEKRNGVWVCDYHTNEFLNNMSCGVVDAYNMYYEKSIQLLQEYIEETNADGENGEEYE